MVKTAPLLKLYLCLVQKSFYIKLFFLLLLVFTFSCKHRQKEVSGKPKLVEKKKTEKTKSKEENKNHNHTDIEQKLGVSQKEIRENKLYAFIDDWYAVPYKYGGCLKSGVDCSCFTNLLCESVYHKKISRSTGEMYQECDKISLEQVKEGDLVFFKINGNSISHVGVYLKKTYFVHSSTSKGVIINSLDEAYYKKYFFCAGRLKKS